MKDFFKRERTLLNKIETMEVREGLASAIALIKPLLTWSDADLRSVIVKVYDHYYDDNTKRLCLTPLAVFHFKELYKSYPNKWHLRHLWDRLVDMYPEFDTKEYSYTLYVYENILNYFINNENFRKIETSKCIYKKSIKITEKNGRLYIDIQYFLDLFYAHGGYIVKSKTFKYYKVFVPLSDEREKQIREAVFYREEKKRICRTTTAFYKEGKDVFKEVSVYHCDVIHRYLRSTYKKTDVMWNGVGLRLLKNKWDVEIIEPTEENSYETGYEKKIIRKELVSSIVYKGIRTSYTLPYYKFSDGELELVFDETMAERREFSRSYEL